MIRNTSLTLFGAAFAMCACAPADRHQDATEEDTQVHADEGEHGDHFEIPETVRRNLGITFAAVEERNVARTIRVPGSFELQPLARHEYRMALPGRIELFVDQYEQVDAGRLLLRFQSPMWPELLHEIILGEESIDTARAEIRVGEERLAEVQTLLDLTRDRIAALARADFKRADLDTEAATLAASLPRLQAEIELARTRLANAERTSRHAFHRAAAASGFSEEELARRVPDEAHGGGEVPKYQTIDWLEVHAREPGIVETLAATDGAFVEEHSLVLTTIDSERVRFRALALQADLGRISTAVSARLVEPSPAPGELGKSVPATLTLGLEAHPLERTVALIATPTARANWIRPGISAFLEIVVDGADQAQLAVPRSAIVRDGLRHVLFRRDRHDHDRVQRLEVELGISDGQWVVIRGDVERGDEVVLAGAYELNLAAHEEEVGQGGHVHADGSVHDDH